jgi:NAD(P)-dependent dehydrogenase (short-subunit alcohol dehydrogenase family)
MEAQEFKGLSVAVIGGALGVGPAVVQAFVEQGAQVAVGAYGNASAMPQAAAVVAADLSSVESIDGLLDQCEAAVGPLSVVVMVPPPVKTAEVMSIPESEFRRVADAELLGPILCLREAARRMIPRSYGRLISFSSMSGKTGVHPHVAPYAAAKGGLITFTRSLAAEIAPTGVTCNVIATALFDVQVAGIQDMAPILKGIPVGRVGRSREAAHAALFLASRDAGYITGETLNLSGGRFMD